MERVKKDAEAQGWSFESELAERLYRGIGGFSGEFKTHDEIRDFISAALLNERVRVMSEGDRLANAIEPCMGKLRPSVLEAWKSWQAFKKKELMGGE